ncbi:MAG: DUF6029 family protein [Prolixibacteraceae bacterium]
MIKPFKYIPLFMSLLMTANVYAQFSASNMAEFQGGNLPGSEPSNLLTFYDQLDLSYRYNAFRFNSRIEQFHASNENPYEYIRLSQLSANYRKKGLEVKLGNFYETLGRGLLLRGYEIKNSVFEDRIYRSRQGFYKDISGANMNYRLENWQIKALWGKTLNNQLPATHPDRRLDVVAGSEIIYQFQNFSLGGIYMNHQLSEQTSHFASIHMEGNISNSITYYGELAKNISAQPNFYTFTDDDQYGAYFNINYSHNDFGASFELKDYHHFTIGSGIADAPTLVKEQSYRLLNRSTHVAEFFDESGYQLEAFYRLKNDAFLTFNHALASNHFGNTDFLFYEFFLEGYFPQKNGQVKTFLDYSSDEFTSEANRYSAGVYYTRTLSKGWALSVETEVQSSSRNSDRFTNAYFGLIASQSTKFSAGLLFEISTDPFLLDEGEASKKFPGISLAYRINTKNNIQLFAGNRRGGPACTSGICYEVLDFRGVELRYTLKL